MFDCAQTFQRGLEIFPNALRERRVFLRHRRDALEAVDDRRVVAAAERRADLHELHCQRSSRIRYIATWRGTVRFFVRVFERSPSVVTPHSLATAC